jgi:quercetin dioxygenase-like cupin family protein
MKHDGGIVSDIFPEFITKLPQAAIPLEGLKAYLSQAPGHQVVVMEFEEHVDLAEHSHARQYGIVLEGKIDLVIGGVSHTFVKGDRYVIPEGVVHSGIIHAGYADVSFFDEANRFKAKD